MSSSYSSGGTPIEGAVALGTGGNRGFGRALVDELLERGAAKVDATSRSTKPTPRRDYMDTDMTADVDAPKADPREVARQTADAIIAGDFETLADDAARMVKSRLSADVAAVYPQLAAG